MKSSIALVGWLAAVLLAAWLWCGETRVHQSVDEISADYYERIHDLMDRYPEIKPDVEAAMADCKITYAECAVIVAREEECRRNWARKTLERDLCSSKSK